MRNNFFSLCLSVCFSLSRLFQTHTHTYTEDSIKINSYEIVQIEKGKLHLQLQIKYTMLEVLLYQFAEKEVLDSLSPTEKEEKKKKITQAICEYLLTKYECRCHW